MALREDGYWDSHYELELKNFEDDGDEGEVWFGKGLSKRIADRLVELICPKIEAKTITRVIDIGCGNAFMLITLLEKLELKLDTSQLKKNLKILGVDYSINSIELSRRIVKKYLLDHLIHLEQCDFLDIAQVNLNSGNEKFDYIIDKGTYDAICLMAGQTEDKLEETKLNYVKSLYSIVKEGSIFILASCNHTEQELMQIFTLDCSNKHNLKLMDKIETPTIQFAGKVRRSKLSDDNDFVELLSMFIRKDS